MPEKIHYIGFLTNVDSSILEIDLKHGFEFKRDTLTNFADFISIMDRSTTDNAEEKLLKEHVISFYDGDNYVYYVYNYHFDKTGKEFLTKHRYLWNIIDLLKLFKEGYVRIPFEYQFYYENDFPKFHRGMESGHLVSRYDYHHVYSLKKEEIPKLQKLVDTITLPFEENSLKLAFQNFNLSYDVYNKNLQFLTLMNALEVLLKPSSAQTDLTYRLSRNAAVLLGENEDDSNQIFKKLKCLYAIRSSIVHRGEPKECEKTSKKRKTLNFEQMIEQTGILRDYVRRSIREMNFIMRNEGKSKDEVLKMLNVRGFGDRPWRD
jgi:hypothetical protein